MATLLNKFWTSFSSPLSSEQWEWYSCCSWWLNQPIWTNLSQFGSFPQVGDAWNHHLLLYWYEQKLSWFGNILPGKQVWKECLLGICKTYNRYNTKWTTNEPLILALTVAKSSLHGFAWWCYGGIRPKNFTNLNCQVVENESHILHHLLGKVKWGHYVSSRMLLSRRQSRHGAYLFTKLIWMVYRLTCPFHPTSRWRKQPLFAS